MYKQLIEAAREGGIEEMVVEVLLCKEDGKILLIEELGGESAHYHFPAIRMQEGETLVQAMQRATVLGAGIEIERVLKYLGYRDEEKKRHFYFSATAGAPYLVEATQGISFAWVELQEAFGYPIRSKTREMLDLYSNL